MKSRPNYTQLGALFHGIMWDTRRCAPQTIIFGFWTLYTHTQLIRDFREIFLATFFVSVCTITASNQSSHFQKLSLLQPEKWSGCYYNTRVAHLGLPKSKSPPGCPRVRDPDLKKKLSEICKNQNWELEPNFLFRATWSVYEKMDIMDPGRNHDFAWLFWSFRSFENSRGKLQNHSKIHHSRGHLVVIMTVFLTGFRFTQRILMKNHENQPICYQKPILQSV